MNKRRRIKCNKLIVFPGVTYFNHGTYFYIIKDNVNDSYVYASPESQYLRLQLGCNHLHFLSDGFKISRDDFTYLDNGN